MRGGYPVRVQEIIWRNSVTKQERAHYFRVGAGMAGECGHRHRTREAAEKCLEPMKLRYREIRWPGRTTKVESKK